MAQATMVERLTGAARGAEWSPGSDPLAAREAGARRPRLARWLAGILVLALAVRLVCLAELASSPTFLAPISDAKGYHDKACALAAGAPLDASFFYQAPGYAFFLGAVYRLSGASIVAAKLVQCGLGALVCLLTAWLGARLVDRRSGVVAGLLLALNGPMVFFETELLPAGLAAALAVALLALLVAARRATAWWRFALLGLAAAAAVTTRPTFVPFVAVALGWLLVARWREGMARAAAVRAVLATALAMAAVWLPVAEMNRRVTGQLTPLPSSGPINLFIGNNPHADETLLIRPGIEWDELQARAGGHEREYFGGLVRDYLHDQPLGFLAGLAWKSAQHFSSRELPRSFDPYGARQSSALLAALMWKVGGFGFPFGVLGALALVGLALRRRPTPALPVVFVVVWSASVILVFAAARYRIPMVPVVTILAAGGLWTCVDAMRARRRAELALAGVVSAAFALASSLPPSFPQERYDYQAEMYHFVGEGKRQRGELDAAITDFRAALHRDPGYAEAWNNLGLALAAKGEPEQAAECFARVVEEQPQLAVAHENWGAALLEAGQPGAALAKLDQALALSPRSAGAHRGRGDALAVLGQLEAAELAYRQAIAADPVSVPARLRLARTLLCLERPGEVAACLAGMTDEQARKRVDPMIAASRAMAQALAAVAADPADLPSLTALVRLQLELGNGRRAVDHLRAAVAERPDDDVLLNALAWQLATWPDAAVRDGGEAVELAERTCRLTAFARPAYLSTLAAAYAELGRFEEAVRTVRTALALVAGGGPERELLASRLASYVEGRPTRQAPPGGPDAGSR